MLSRTADHLYWMARYMERAENTARMLDVNYQTSLLPQSADAAENGWKGLLSISELTDDYTSRYGAVTDRKIMDYMVGDERNPSSIYSCLMAARENARAVRGTLTTEVWETQNQTWLEFQRLLRGKTFQKDPGEGFEWVKFRSHLSRGVTVGTMLQDEAFHFLRIGSFLERADNTARMLDVNYQTSLLPQSADAVVNGWKGLLSISELSPDYASRYGEIDARKVMDYMVSDERNPSSIYSCLMAARENARAVRGTLTTEVWETQNQTWLEFQRMLRNKSFQKDPGESFEWVKFRSHLSRGVTVGTMLQDEAFHFLRIGSFLERADNTARMLDVKFHAVESEFFGTTNGQAAKDQEFDFYHWSAILRSVSGFEVYRKAYRNVIRPEKVAELLILRADMPRSLAACMDEVVSNLHHVANEQSGETLRRAGRLQADLKFGRIDEILATGLHAFLTQFLDRVGTLGIGISRDFLVPVAA